MRAAFSMLQRVVLSGAALLLFGVAMLLHPAPARSAQSVPAAAQVVVSTILPNQFTQVGYSPDSKTLTTATLWGELLFWNPQTGVYMGKWEDCGRQFAYSPDGSRIASLHSSNVVKVWDARAGYRLRVLDTRYLPDARAGLSTTLTNLAFSPDGKMLAVGSIWSGEDGKVNGRVWLWNPQTGVLERTLTILSGEAVSLAFSPDGKTLAVGSGGIVTGGVRGSLTLWNPQTGALLRTLIGSNIYVSGVHYAPDGKSILYTNLLPGLESASGSLELRDTRTGALRWKTSRCVGGAFSPNGKTIANGSSGLRLLSTRTGKTQFAIPLTDENCMVAFAPDSGTLALAGRNFNNDTTLQIWNAHASTLRATLTGPEQIRAVAFDHDGRSFTTVNITGAAATWSLRTGKLLRTHHKLPSHLFYVAVSPDGTNLAYENSRLENGQVTGALRVSDIATSKTLHTLAADPRVYSVTYSPDGRCLACGTSLPFPQRGAEIVVWDIGTGKVLFRLPDQADIIYSVVYAPNGELLTNASVLQTPIGEANKIQQFDIHTTIKVWNAHTGQIAHTLPVQAGDAIPLAFLPDNRTLIVSHITRTDEPRNIQLWDIISGKLLREWKLSATEHALTFTPDRAVLASADKHGTITLRDSATGQVKQTFVRTAPSISRLTFSPYGLTFSPDGRTLIATGDDSGAEKITVWDVPSGRARVTLQTLPVVGSWIAYTPDGYYNGSADAESFIQWLTDGSLLPWNQFPDRRQPQRVQAAFANPRPRP